MAKRKGQNAETHSGDSAAKPKRRTVAATVRLDVATHARVSAAAVYEGMDKSAFMAKAIKAAVRGYHVVVRKDSASDDAPDQATPEDIGSDAA